FIIFHNYHSSSRNSYICIFRGFAMDICKHFLTAFNHVTRGRVNTDEVPWKRLEKNGVEHTHASIHCPEAWQFCEVEQHLMTPVVHNGIKDMKVLKTTLSGFESSYGTIFTTLKDAKDRFFCTSVYARWKTVKDTIIQKFAGPYDHGEYFPSVQKTLYERSSGHKGTIGLHSKTLFTYTCDSLSLSLSLSLTHTHTHTHTKPTTPGSQHS
uniref:Uricase n=1 Tax=Cyprinus carpio TaxID=7962 RepID=A0A8C2C2F2_CYPCA